MEVSKEVSGARPRTVVRLSESGRQSFLDYLKTLESVLQRAVVAAREDASAGLPAMVRGVDFFGR